MPKENININIPELFSSYFPDKISRQIALSLSKNLEEGNICIDLENDFLENQNLKVSSIKLSPYLSTYPDKKIKPFVLYEDRLLYMHRFFSYESIILNKLSELSRTGSSKKNEVLTILSKNKILIDSILFKSENSNKWQNIATLSALLNPFSLTTGGPGTGKTTSISKFINVYLSLFPESRIILTAPTGKAAVRMNESLVKLSENITDTILKNKIQKIKSQTLHRLLGLHKYNTVNSFSKDYKIPFDVVIVDESSMIDISLMAKLFNAIDAETKLIMLGDKNQLSPIGAGSIFGDLCSAALLNKFSLQDIKFFNSFSENVILNSEDKFDNSDLSILSGKVVELKQSFRFSDSKGIGKLSSLILEGNQEKLTEYFDKEKKTDSDVYISENIENEFAEKLFSMYEDYALEDDINQAFLKFNRIRILCSVTEGKYSVNYFNRLIETRLKEKKLINTEGYMYDKQAVMITQNDYNLGVFNGDIGLVRIDKESGKYFVFFQLPELRKISSTEIKRFVPAYALSIHKSQGSEFENVIVVLNETEKTNFLSRELIYTAITRAKQKVMIISSREILNKAIANKISRMSGIKYKLDKLNQVL
jgi:exodeoxyribonuclease V alpha subunit